MNGNLPHFPDGLIAKKAPEGAFFVSYKPWGLGAELTELNQSRSPPMMPNKASRLWNTLKMSKYKAKVALM